MVKLKHLKTTAPDIWNSQPLRNKRIARFTFIVNVAHQYSFQFHPTCTNKNSFILALKIRILGWKKNHGCRYANLPECFVWYSLNYAKSPNRHFLFSPIYRTDNLSVTSEEKCMKYLFVPFFYWFFLLINGL